jgi:hypothetical protein
MDHRLTATIQPATQDRHDRHTFVTTMLDASVSLRDVQIAARHPDPAPCATTAPARTSTCTPTTPRLITGKLHAHYLLILKANQPLALQACQVLLSGSDTQFAEAMSMEEDRGHGRTERRTLRVAPAGDSLFPGARQVFRLRRDTGGLDGQRTREEIVYGIVSMPAELAGPAQLNHYAREHWCVGNRLHWTRDVTFREGHSQQRTGAAPRALASFRNLTLNTYRLAGRANIAHTRRDLHDRTDAFAVYGI